MLPRQAWVMESRQNVSKMIWVLGGREKYISDNNAGRKTYHSPFLSLPTSDLLSFSQWFLSVNRRKRLKFQWSSPYYCLLLRSFPCFVFFKWTRFMEECCCYKCSFFFSPSPVLAQLLQDIWCFFFPFKKSEIAKEQKRVVAASVVHVEVARGVDA